MKLTILIASLVTLASSSLFASGKLIVNEPFEAQFLSSDIECTPGTQLVNFDIPLLVSINFGTYSYGHNIKKVIHWGDKKNKNCSQKILDFIKTENTVSLNLTGKRTVTSEFINSPNGCVQQLVERVNVRSKDLDIKLEGVEVFQVGKVNQKNCK